MRATRTAMPVIYFTIATISLLTFLLGGADHSRKMIITALTVAFSVRLGVFLVYRSLNIPGGSPPSKRKTRPWSFWIFALFAPLVFCLPAIFCNSPLAPGGDLGTIELFGVLLATLGMVIEAVADHQKFTFRDNPKNEGKWCDTGLFKYARYPHFFGDVCFWWGIFLVGVPTLGFGAKWIALLCPLMEVYIIFAKDGVPQLNWVHDQSYGNNPAYVQYKRSTSTLIPCPPWLYKKFASSGN